MPVHRRAVKPAVDVVRPRPGRGPIVVPSWIDSRRAGGEGFSTFLGDAMKPAIGPKIRIGLSNDRHERYLTVIVT